VIHFHEDCLHLPWTRRLRCATVTTMHGRMDLRDLEPLYREYAEVPLVSISDAQREPMPLANWCATVYHGLPDDLYRFHPEPGGYLAFLGRICPEKRVDRAIAIARRAGIELKIAAKVDAADKDYFETEIRHLLDDPRVDFIGEIGEGEKEAFLGGAAALLMPIDWPEPFGLVVIEAMACGTPVIAFPFGSMPELIEPGVNGALVQSLDQTVEAVEALAVLDRSQCRRSFEERFTATGMAKNYVRLYREQGPAAVCGDLSALGLRPRCGHRASLDRRLLVTGKPWSARLDHGRVHDLASHGEIAGGAQAGIEAREQTLDRTRLGQLLAEQPDRLGVWDAVLERQSKEAPEGEPVANLILGLVVGKRVERLQQQDLEHQHRIVGWSAPLGPIRACERRLQLRPEQREVDHPR
jgi:glycosyl transferase family 1